MGTTTFSGPVVSDNGFIGSITLPTDITGNTITANTGFVGPLTGSNNYGTNGSPIAVVAAGNVNTGYATTSAASGDTRLMYEKLFFTSTGSGETLRAYSVVSGAGAAAGGTINGAHISMKVDTGGTISGAANALRATLGSGVNTPGGTLAAIQVDTDFSAGTTLPASASWIRFTESGTAKMTNLFNVPAAMVVTKSAAAVAKTIKIVDDAGTPWYIMVSAAN